MTATVTRTKPDSPAAARPLPRRRSSRLLLLVVVLCVIGALLGSWAYRNAASRTGVVAVARALPFGTIMQPTDLREANLPVDTGLAAIAWSEADRVIGMAATTDLRAGQTLTPDAVGAPVGPAADEAVVGLSVPAGRSPSEPLSPRDAVLVITGSGPSRAASVVRADGPDMSGHRNIDVLVSRSDAADLALASMSDRVAVVLVGRG